MFLKTQTKKYIKDYLIQQLAKYILETYAIIIGAGAGLSTSAGFTYSGERFENNFSDFIQKYHFSDMYSGGFYPFKTLEEQWAYWSRYIYINRYKQVSGRAYKDLFEIVKNKNYFVLTTNVDHQFQISGFDKKRLFYTQGDYGLWQCSKPCHQKTYDNEEIVRKMLLEQKNMRIPSELVPHCPICNAPMSMNLRADDTFVEDEGWHTACNRYKEFIQKYKQKVVLYLELGVGENTPSIIKYPFWQMTYNNKNAVYACINLSKIYIPYEIDKQSICIENDISQTLEKLKNYIS